MDNNEINQRIYGTPFDNRECHNCSHYLQICTLGHIQHWGCNHWEPDWARLHKFDTHEWHSLWGKLRGQLGSSPAKASSKLNLTKINNQNKNKEKWLRIKSFNKGDYKDIR